MSDDDDGHGLEHAVLGHMSLWPRSQVSDQKQTQV